MNGRQPEPEASNLNTATTVIDALGKFLAQPSLLSKQMAIEALSAHMELSNRKEVQTA